jgi:FtsX-like permease family
MESLEGLSQGELRMALLRRLAQRLVQVVLDVDLRKPDEDRCLSAQEADVMRSASYVAGLAWRRLRRRDSGAFVTALGLVVATAVLAGVLAGVTIATDRSTARAIEGIPTSARSVRAVWFGIPADESERLAVLDSAVADAFSGFGFDGPIPLILFRESTVAGHYVGISAVDGVGPNVMLRTGRLPRTCTPERCEVLRLRGRGALPNAPGLRLVQVGTATLRSRQLYGDFLRSTDAATADVSLAPALQRSGRYHRPPPAPLVVAEGRSALEHAAALARTYRTYAWVWPLAPGRPRLWEIDDLVRRSERARVELTARSSSFAVEAPVEELRAAERSANIAGRRLLLVGGEGAALLLAFTVLAARGMRRDLEDARRRLVWFGAQRWQLWLLTGIESSAVAAVGVLAGWLLGVVVAAVAATLAGAPVSDVLRESVLSPEGLGIAVVTALVAATLVWLTVSLRPREGTRFGVVDFVAVAAVLVTGVALAGGVADEDRLARGDSSALLLLLLPGLVAVAAAIVVARVFPVLARWWSDRGRGSVATRLAAVGLGRGPGAAVATVAFLTIAFALALLAEGYRATLARSDREQAAFQVPLDIVVREDLENLVRVFDVASPARFRALVGPGGEAHPVLRVTGGAGRAEQVSGVTVLGLDPAAIENVGVWRADWAGGRDPSDLARLVDPGGPVEQRGIRLPRGRIVLTTGPGLLSFAGIVRLADGSFRRVELGSEKPRASVVLRARVPSGAQLVSLELVPPPRIVERGADAGIAFVGTARLSGTLARRMRAWIGVGGVVTATTPAGVVVRAPLTPQRMSFLRPRQPTDDSPPSVLATPRLAELAGGVGGLLPLQIGGASVPVQVAGVVDRFPGASGETVVGARTELRTAIDTVSPGAGRENELWLAVPSARVSAVANKLARPPYRALATTVRADVEADARQDPLAHGTLLALLATAFVALVLASLGLALAVRADLRDDRGEHYDLEAQGSSPAFLRRVVRARAASLSVAGLVAGLATGIGLLALVTRVVSVTARGGTPEPPLAVVVDLRLVAVGVAGFALLTAALVGSATRRAFAGARGPSYRETE